MFGLHRSSKRVLLTGLAGAAIVLGGGSIVAARDLLSRPITPATESTHPTSSPAPKMPSPTPSANPPVLAAERIAACEQTHGLDRAHVAVSSWSGFDYVTDTLTVETCAWPPGPGADASGYSRITVGAHRRPGVDGAAFDGQVDEVVIPVGCNVAAVDYTWGQMGLLSNVGWTYVRRGQYAVLNAEGRWPANHSDVLGPAGMTFTNSSGYILHNSHAKPSDAKCAG
jgi:hypothetical protein